MALPFPVLAAERHAAVLEKVKTDLLTPFGPRTLKTIGKVFVAISRTGW